MIARIGLALLLAASVASAEPQAEKPSFVFILIDDLGWRDVGFQGECFFDTPGSTPWPSRGWSSPAPTPTPPAPRPGPA